MLNDDALNANQVAEMLHIGRNRVYTLAKSGELPSYQVGRKILFALKDIQAYSESLRKGALATSNASTTPDSIPCNSTQSYQSSLTTPDLITNHSEPSLDVPLVAGSGMALDFLVNRLEMEDIHVRRLPMESYSGLVQLYKGHVSAALAHLYDQRTNSYNIPYIQRLVPGTPVVAFRLLRRWQGFVVAPGNPNNFRTWGSLLKEGVRLANTKRGSGSRVLLDEKLVSLEDIPARLIGYGNEYPTDFAAAEAVSAGVADVALVGEDVAAQLSSVEFIPMQQECLALVVSKQPHTRPLIRKLKTIFADEAFCREYGRVVHGTTDGLGSIVYEC